MGKNNDKSLVNWTVISCIIAIVGPHVAFFFLSNGDFLNPVFWITDILLLAFFIYGVKAAYKNVDTAKDNATRWFIVIIAALMFLWVGGWAAGGNEKVLSGSPQMEVAK
jgi:predicted Na+-dependent transporter